MDPHESNLQPDGTTFPPVTPDVPAPPGMEELEVPDPILEPESPDEQGHESGASESPG